MDRSLIEAVFEHHSKSHAAINCLQDQLHSLEILRDSAKRSFAVLQESGVDLDKSTNSILRSSSRYLIPSPEHSPHLKKAATPHTKNFISDFLSSLDESQIQLPGTPSKSQQLTSTEIHHQNDSPSKAVNNKSTGSNHISPHKMRLSESQMSGFDVSAILAQVSPPGAYTSRSPAPLHNLSNGSTEGDELLNILEKISFTSHQLQGELENARLRESRLIDEIKVLKSRENGFHKFSPNKKSGSSSCDRCGGKTPEPKTETERKLQEVGARCEKLQDAMLSLQEENIKLNKILRDQSLMTNENDDVSTSSEVQNGKIITMLNDKLVKSQQEVSRLQQKVDKLNENLVTTENCLQQEREETAHLQEMMKQKNSDINEESKSSYTEQQLQKLCSELQRKSDKLQMENNNYLKRIEILEEKLNSAQQSNFNEEAYNLRIDDLHTAILSKEEQITALKEKLKKSTEQMNETEKKHEKIKNGDITKRKEVLLLCERYEQLKKNKKRLESDLHESQQKLQEATTRCWALETSGLKTAEENTILKKQLKIHENVISSSSKVKSHDRENFERIVKDYERLTEKYEALLDLRLSEYDRIRKASRGRRSMKQNDIGGNRVSRDKELRLEERAQAVVDTDGFDNSVLSESMRKRQRDFRQFYSSDSGRRTRSKSVDTATFTSGTKYHDPVLKVDKQTSPYSSSRESDHRPKVESYRETPQTKSGDYNEQLFIGDCTRNFPKSTKDNYDFPMQNWMSGSHRHGQTVTPHKNTETSSTNQAKDIKSDIKTSTPLKSPRLAGNSSQRKENIRYEYENKSKSSPNYTSLSRYSPSPRYGYRHMEMGQHRSKSLSPIRVSDRGDGDVSDYRPSSSRESQKSVSFLLSPTHRRSKSSNSVLDRNYQNKTSTPQRQPVPSGKKTSLSPVEVLERVKSAYQEEYLQNMAGVNFVLSPRNSPPGQKNSFSGNDNKQKNIKTSPQDLNAAHSGALLCAERYKKSAESIKNFLDKNYGSTYDSNYALNTSSSPSSSISPKGILKKPKNSMNLDQSNKTETSYRSSFQYTPRENDQHLPLVVRETEDESRVDVTSIKNLSPPEMFQDCKFKRKLTYDDKVDSSREEDDIIEVKARMIKREDSTLSLESPLKDSSIFSNLLTDRFDKFRTYTSRPQMSSDLKKNQQSEAIKSATRDMMNDLTLPIQFAKALKDDDDTDSVGQSSISSTRDHIGRYEFLQEMQTTLKTPGFSYQKVEGSNESTLDSSPKLDDSDKAKQNSDIGLSARQQEYADKLVKKYMRKAEK